MTQYSLEKCGKVLLYFGNWICIGSVRMPPSKKITSILFAPFAISRIMQRCWLPGLIGLLLLGIGVWQRIGWLQLSGIVLAAPIIWVYAVVIFGFLPYAVFETVRRKMRRE